LISPVKLLCGQVAKVFLWLAQGSAGKEAWLVSHPAALGVLQEALLGRFVVSPEGTAGEILAFFTASRGVLHIGNLGKKKKTAKFNTDLQH